MSVAGAVIRRELRTSDNVRRGDRYVGQGPPTKHKRLRGLPEVFADGVRIPSARIKIRECR